MDYTNRQKNPKIQVNYVPDHFKKDSLMIKFMNKNPENFKK